MQGNTFSEGADIILCGLEKRPELNGCLGQLGKRQGDRWKVTVVGLLDDMVLIQEKNMLLKSSFAGCMEGALVKIRSLATRTDLNGRMGSLGKSASGAFVVHVEGEDAPFLLEETVISFAGAKFLKSQRERWLEPKTSCYNISTTAERGRCLVAARHIKRGEIILEELPVLEWRGTADTYCTVDPNIFRYIRDELQLAACSGTNDLQGIQDTNKFDRGCDMYALFHHISFFNHSCTPNVSLQALEECLFKEGMPGRVHANRDIMQGEELCLSYIRELDPAATRQQQLRESYGFYCRCDACWQPEAQKSESDKRRGLIAQGLTLMGLPMLDENDVPDHAEPLSADELLEFLEAEKISSPAYFYPAHKMNGMMVIARDGSLPEAKEYFKESYRCACIAYGVAHSRSREVLGYVQDPKASWF